MHPLHKVVSDAITEANLPDCTVVKEPACGGNQRIPLFCSAENSRHTEYCNVDMLVLASNRVKVIVEIEEATITPIQVYGKFLASALSSFFIHEYKNDVPIEMNHSVLFTQILDTSKLKRNKTAKMKQWRNIERSIQNVIPLEGNRIDHYKLFYRNSNDFELGGAERNKLVDYIRPFFAKASN